MQKKNLKIYFVINTVTLRDKYQGPSALYRQSNIV